MLAADVPAGAKVTARALARMYAGWLDGTVVPSSLARGAWTESSSGEDQVYGNPSRWGLGFALGLPFEGIDAPNAFGMAGAGGSWAGADPDRGIAVAVTKNVLSMDFVAVERLVTAVYDAYQETACPPCSTMTRAASSDTAVTSASGSRFSTRMSAAFPGTSVPTSSSIRSSRAMFTVIDCSAARVDRPTSST